MFALLVIFAASVIFLSYFAERIAYQETESILENVESLILSRGRDNQGLVGLRRPDDLSFGVWAFSRTWLEVGVCVLLLRALDSQLFPSCVLAILIAGRFRALQEISHFAIHCALGGSPSLQLTVANIFFQYPLMRVSARTRRRAHVAIHHRNSNVPGRDPNLDDLKSAGIATGCGTKRLLLGVFYPLWPRIVCRNILEGLSLCARGSLAEVAARLSLVLGLALFIYSIAGWPGIIFGFVIPRFLIYPWFAWLSQLLEHKWFAPMLEQRRFFREFAAGRRTQYGPIVGPVLRYFVLPVGDSYHLSHSLLPRLRWNYLPIADRILASRMAEYSVGSSIGLFYARRIGMTGAGFGWLWTISRPA